MKLRRLAPSPVISAPVAGSTSHRFWTTALVLALLLLFASALAVYLERGGSSGGTHEALSEDERFVLSEFYHNDDSRQTDAIGSVCERFSIERSSAYNKKNRALARLALLLYGK